MAKKQYCQHHHDEAGVRIQIENSIRAIYPIVFNFTREQTATLLGCSAGHLSNRESAKKPIIEPSYLDSKVVYSFMRIVDYLVKQEISTQNRIFNQQKRKPGRPSKASIFAARVDFNNLNAGGR